MISRTLRKLTANHETLAERILAEQSTAIILRGPLRTHNHFYLADTTLGLRLLSSPADVRKLLQNRDDIEQFYVREHETNQYTVIGWPEIELPIFPEDVSAQKLPNYLNRKPHGLIAVDLSWPTPRY